MVNLPYDRRDADSILDYLKYKATELSNGRWTDFSNGDVGTVILKLIAYVADMNNFQIDKGLAELYIDTLTERESALSLVKLIGYEVRGYKSAHTVVNLSLPDGVTITDGETIPAYTKFSNSSRTISFYNVVKGSWTDNEASLVVYQGTYNSETKLYSDITDTAKIYLQSDKVDPVTVSVTANGKTLVRVDNTLVDVSDNASFSVHIDSKDRVYIQLPANVYENMSDGSTVNIEYLISDGTNGNIGANILTVASSSEDLGVSDNSIIVSQPESSEGAEDPETIEEIQEGAPLFASTMNTLVTLDDIQLAKYKVDGIADLVALDYNSPESGLIQPNDAYKVNIYVLPNDSDEIIDQGVLTDIGENLKKWVDERRLTSIMVNYLNVDIITPIININAYIDPYSLKLPTLENDIKNIILDSYDRKVFGIGDGLFVSKISKQILDKIDYCDYIEITIQGHPEGSIIPNKKEFIKVISENINIDINPN